METIGELAEKVRAKLRHRAGTLRLMADALDDMADAYRPDLDYDDLRLAQARTFPSLHWLLEVNSHQELAIDMSQAMEAIVACNDAQMEHEEALAEARWDRRVEWANGDN